MTVPPKISIIVPIYNSELFLSDCIESILSQTFANFELILIDDGSIDKSGQICDLFAISDSRVKVFHNVHGGASSARNNGIQEASGDFIGWVDADDYISREMFKVLCELAINTDADIVECQYYFLQDNKMIRSGKEEPLVICEGDQILKEFFSARMKPSLCNKLYKRSIWESIQFPLGRKHQDCYVNMRFALMPLRYVRISDPLYYYCERDNSITTTRTSREIREALYLYDYTMGLSQNIHFGSVAQRYLKRDAINRMLNRFFEIATSQDIYPLELYTSIIRRRLGLSLFSYISYWKVSPRTKIGYLLILFNLKTSYFKLKKIISKISMY